MAAGGDLSDFQYLQELVDAKMWVALSPAVGFVLMHYVVGGKKRLLKMPTL